MTRISKRLSVAVGTIAAAVGALYYGIASADGAEGEAEAIASMVTVCVPAIFATAAAYIWGESRRPSAQGRPKRPEIATIDAGMPATDDTDEVLSF